MCAIGHMYKLSYTESDLDMRDSPAPFESHLKRRRFLQTAAAGTVISAFGGLYVLCDDLLPSAEAKERNDGRSRVPPGQRVIRALKPMGGTAGDPSPSRYRLKVHGAVHKPFELTFKELVSLASKQPAVDVHCVTGWTVLGARFEGVPVKHLAERAQLDKSAHFVIFEAAHGYTSNVPLRDALKPNVMVAHRLDGQPLSRAHGGPVRAVVPDLYFWKSAKWLTGIRFAQRDEPGYWETRGYNNHADPWREQRYS